MSYSMSIRAATKAEAKEKAARQFDDVVKNQAVHEKDRAAALAAAGAFIDLLADDDTKDVTLSMHGSVSWFQQPGDHSITSASVGVSAQLVNRN